jgi:Histidine kinase-, DNA gyrase B-, and HSP90-like ATPase
MGLKDSNYIIALDKFIQSTRDSGYKSTGSAISELVDNALQANATRVDIFISSNGSDEDHPIQVAVLDNGEGMTASLLRQALRFGGSSRFNDRRGLGRYGMGLPNASLGQARRFHVYSWRKGQKPIATYLDVDEIASGKMTEVPESKALPFPKWLQFKMPVSGTLVEWVRCDRLDNRRLSTMVRKLNESLGRTFRHFLWDGVEIAINGEPVVAIDPLFLNKDSRYHGANMFQDVWTCEIAADPEKRNSDVGSVVVTFSELPIDTWHKLSNDEKRHFGISNGAGISVVRGNREVDFGWFFVGSKRRENYDDWWRCEVRFDPILDEAFGITHTKQMIRPKDYLVEALQPHIETVAKALNGRVREAHAQLNSSKAAAAAEALASARDSNLKPLPKGSKTTVSQGTLRDLMRRNGAVKAAVEQPKNGRTHYKIVEDKVDNAIFFQPFSKEGLVLAVVDPRHRFYKTIYQPLLEGRRDEIEAVSRKVQLFLLAAARAEATFTKQQEQSTLERFRKEWSEALDILLRGN